MWYEAYLIKQALTGMPLDTVIDKPKTVGVTPGPKHELSDYRLADKWLNSLPPSHREVPLRRTRARLNVQEMQA